MKDYSEVMAEPKDPGWKDLAEAVTPGGRITQLRRLEGAGTSDAYDVTLDRGPRRVVVKLFRDGDDTAPREWSNLKFAQRVAIPVPEPMAADLESAWFGRPAVVMSRLPGRPDVTPKDVDSWILGFAQMMSQLHQTALDEAEGVLTQPPMAETWLHPAGELGPQTAAAVSAIKAHLPSLTSERVFIHGDFQPSNVLWQSGHVSGVVDWSSPRLDSRWSELAYCRAEVCLLFGPDVADRLADAYSEIVGDTSEELAVYDLMCAFGSRHYAEESLQAYREQGHAANLQRSLAYLDEQLQRALKRLD